MRVRDPISIRKSFAQESFELGAKVPYLVSLQKDSYKKFLQRYVDPLERKNFGIQAVFNSFFPITDAAERITVEFIKYSLGDSKYDAGECLFAGRTYSVPLKAQLRLILWHQEEGSDTKEISSIKEQEVYLCDVPLMTETGSFIINGAERVIVSQMRRAPGVFFDSESIKISTTRSYTAKIVPHLGSWLDFEFDSKDILYFRVDKKRKIPISSFLRALDMSNAEMIRDFYGSSTALLTDHGWILKFDPKQSLGKKHSHDLIDAKTGEVKVKEGTKFTQKLVNKLVEEGFSSYLLNEAALLGYVLAQDLIDTSSGKVLLEAGSVVTKDSLEVMEKFNFKSVSIVNPSKADIGPYLFNTMSVDKNLTQKDSLFDIYKAIRLGEIPSSIEIAKNYFDSLFFSSTRYDLSEVGRMKMNHRLQLSVDKSTLHLTPDDIKQTIKVLSSIKHNDLKTDDIDNLANRRVRTVGELVENQLRIGMSRIERSIMEKMNLVNVDVIMPQNLINSKPLITAIKDFFATSQLSQFMDQTNPLSEITHKRRISALGPGGLTRERATFEVRDVHSTHYGRICPIETPEGQNIGLINSLATYARINDYGFIETPYRKVFNGVVSDEVVYLSALEEVDATIAPSTLELDAKGKVKSDLISCRRNGEYVMMPSDKLDYIDVSTKQVVSVATTLIPFLENDDANRALMGANMQRQAVPLLKPEVPLVGTGMERVVASDSNAVLVSKYDGVVKFVDAAKIVIESINDEGLPFIEVYSLAKYTRSNQDTCINQRPLVKDGDKVSPGQVLTDGCSVKNGELALGKNVRVAFMPWNGYNFEDSIIISEKLLVDDAFTSVHIEEFEVVARDTRLGPEEITRDIPNVSEESLARLDEEGIIHIGAQVNPDDILVGKTTPKSEAPVTPEEKLLRVIFGDKASDVRDSSLYVPTGVSGKVVDVKIFTRKGIEKDQRQIYIEMQQIEELAKRKELQLSFLTDSLKESLVKTFAGKKLVSEVEKLKSKTELKAEELKTLPKAMLLKVSVNDADAMENAEKFIAAYNEQAKQIEHDFNAKVERIRGGEELGQGVLKIVKVYVASKYHLQPGDKMAGRHGNKGVVSKIAPVEDMPYSADGEPVDIVLNPIGVPSRMNIGQILETHLGFASKVIGRQIGELLDKIEEEKSKFIKELRDKLLLIYSSKNEETDIKAMSDRELMEFAANLKNGVPFATGIFEGMKSSHLDALLEIAGVDKSGQIELFDGKTGRKFDRKVTVGYIYMLKLHHLVDDKIHARSIGPYSLITQQPLGGKSHFGGQRFGEMECWALQAYGAAYSLQEMLTVKSDDVVGRIKIYESIIRGDQNFVCGIPESFNVMIKEVRSLGLNVELIEDN